MAQIKRKARKTKDSVRIQVQARIPVPRGYTLAPEVVTEILENWVNGEDLDYAEVRMVNWEINGKRGGEVKATPEVDTDGSLRYNMIRRFLGLARIRSTRQMGTRKI